MSINVLQIKQGSTLPILSFLLSDDSGPADLTGATVKIRVVGSYGVVLFGPSACDVSATPTDGTVTYTLVDGDLATAGDYRAEFIATYSNGVKIYPSNGYIGISVIAALA